MESQDTGHSISASTYKSDINFYAKWKDYSIEINETSLRKVTEAHIPSFNHGFLEVQGRCNSRQMKMGCHH